jgi:hypothetical protein
VTHDVMVVTGFPLQALIAATMAVTTITIDKALPALY